VVVKLKKLFFLIILLLSVIFFSFQDNLSYLIISKDLAILRPNINYTNSFFQNYRTLLIDYSTIKFRYAELDLTLKFLFKEKDCQIPSLQEDYEKILNQYSFLFDQQFAAFKYYITKFINKNKKLYQISNPRLDDDNYLKEFYKILIYRNFMLFNEIEGLGFILLNKAMDINSILKEDLILGFFNNRHDSILYYISKMFISIPQINTFYEQYINTLNNYFNEYEFEKIYDFICNTLNIKFDKTKKIIVNILPINYINKKEKDNKFNPLAISKIEDFAAVKVFGYMSESQMILGLDNFKSKRYFIKCFMHELAHYYQYFSTFINDELEKKYITYYLPQDYKSISQWNKFISSFLKAEEYQICEFDAEFTSLYQINLYKAKYPEKLDIDDRTNIMSEDKIFILDIYLYLLKQYLSYCKINNVSQIFYSINTDSTIDREETFLFSDKNPNNKNVKNVKENYINFFKNWIYPNKDKILYDIYRAIRYFQFDVE